MDLRMLPGDSMRCRVRQISQISPLEPSTGSDLSYRDVVDYESEVAERAPSKVATPAPRPPVPDLVRPVERSRPEVRLP